VHVANEQTPIFKKYNVVFLSAMDIVVAKAALLVRDAPRLRAAINARQPLPNYAGKNSLAEYNVMSAFETINKVAEANNADLEIALDDVLSFDWQQLMYDNQDWVDDVKREVCERMAVPSECRTKIDEMLTEMEAGHSHSRGCSCKRRKMVADNDDDATIRWSRTINALSAYVNRTVKEWMDVSAPVKE
jgi:hypothetical protein